MKQLLEKFYSAFQNLDAGEMVSCYHDEIVFRDPAFGELRGSRAGNMWKMLCASQKGKDFQVIFSDISVEGEVGKVHWEAFYTFGKSGRKIHNKIDATFKFKEGKIIEHVDQFNLHRWAGQALGMTGYVIGWTSYFRDKLNKQTNGILDRFEGDQKDCYKLKQQ